MRMVQIEEDRLKQLIDAGKTMKDLLAEFNCSLPTLYRAINKFGLVGALRKTESYRERNRKKRERLFPLLENRDELLRLYNEEKKTIGEISKIVGCSPCTVGSALVRQGITPRDAYDTRRLRNTVVGTRKRFPQLFDEAWVRQKYVAENKTIREISEELQCNRGAVGVALKLFSIPRRTHQRADRARSGSFSQLYDKAWLIEEFINKNRDVKNIAEELGCARWTVVKALQRLKIRKFPDRSQEKVDPSLPPGVKKRRDGYIMVFRRDHPNAGPQGYIMQHRLVAEEALGRYLTGIEEVHHLNLSRSDNRLSNLLVMADHGMHRRFHVNPPAWVPRCPHCNKPHPESLAGRPEGVPLLYEEV